MRKKGILDAESNAGKVFCTEHCPYPEGCIVVEDTVRQKNKELWYANQVTELLEQRHSVKSIASTVGISTQTIHRFLKAKKEAK